MTDAQIHETVNDILDNIEAAQKALRKINDALFDEKGGLIDATVERSQVDVLLSTVAELQIASKDF